MMCIEDVNLNLTDMPKRGFGWVEVGPPRRKIILHPKPKEVYLTEDHMKVTVAFKNGKPIRHGYSGIFVCKRVDGIGHTCNGMLPKGSGWWSRRLYGDVIDGVAYTSYRSFPVYRRWMRDSKTSTIQGYDGCYPTGFHVYLEKPTRSTVVYVHLIKVEWKEPVAFGTQWGEKVVVCRARRRVD